MSTLDQLREGLTRAWETVTEGWRELVERAGDALTRFHHKQGGTEVETREERIARQGARWGVLAAEVKLTDDDFEIDVVDDVLVIRGEKHVERERNEGRYHVMERAYGAFERAVRLPAAVDEARAKASYRRGVLHVSLPRSSAHKTRRIEVKAG